LGAAEELHRLAEKLRLEETSHLERWVMIISIQKTINHCNVKSASEPIEIF
jgi:hypothetical protein